MLAALDRLEGLVLRFHLSMACSALHDYRAVGQQG